MNDKTFINILDNISKKEKTPSTYAAFLTTLFNGYNEGLGLLGVYAVENKKDRLLFIGDANNKTLLFFTKREYFYKLKKNTSPEMQSDIYCRYFSCREIINNILDDTTIAGIIFNVHEKNRFDLARVYFEKYFEEGFFERIEPNVD